MISIENVSKRFKDKIIFDDINFSIDRCGVYLIDGESGCGKSTLLNIIAQLISYKGMVINDHNESLAYVSQNNFLLEHLSVKENLDFLNIDYEILNKFGLIDKLSSNVNDLSIGERARVSLIAGLYSKSELLLIDEPITNLDNKNSKKVVNEILKFSKSKIILVISHEKKLFINSCDGILKIKNNKVYFTNKSDNARLINRDKRHFLISAKYFFKELMFYKKDNMKMYAFILFLFLFSFLVLLFDNLFLNNINKDMNNCLDYNKFYLGECESSKNGSIKIEYCKNPSEETIYKMEKDGVKIGINYDYLLSFLYKRDDLFVIKNSVKLNKGRYPKTEFEVITSDKYQLNQKISLQGSLFVMDDVNDVYDEEIVLTVVGIYEDLLFLNNDNIYFDYDLVDKYYKDQKLINNDMSLFDYFLTLKINEYKYIGFFENKLDYVSMKGAKYDFYSNLLKVYKELHHLIKWILLFVVIYFYVLILRFNKSKLKTKQKSNAYLISNSFPIVKSIFISLILDVVYSSFIYLILIFISFIVKLDILVITMSYLGLIMLIIIQTYFYYKKTNVSNLLREEIW